MVQNLNILGIKGNEDWFFGTIKRDQANEILLKGTVGMFMVRESAEPGNFAISVRDKQKVSHYKIIATKCQSQDGYKFQIGTMEFRSIEYIIKYYKKIKLGDSTLTEPAPRMMFRAKYDYNPTPVESDASGDICLRRNECVIFLGVMFDPNGAENPEWWHVIKLNTGERGYVPSSYLRQSSPGDTDDGKFGFLCQLNVPFDVEVMRARNPNIFDSSQLRLELGDLVHVKYIIPDQPEIWFGLNVRTKQEGTFPFSYVRPFTEVAGGVETYRLSGVSSASLGSSRGGGCGGCGNRTSQVSGGALDEQAEDGV